MNQPLSLRKSFYFLRLALVLAGLASVGSPGAQAQMLMNLAPQAIPNSTTGPGYANTLSTFKQAVDQQAPPAAAKQAPPVDANAKPAALPPPSEPLPQPCALKVKEMNRIQRHKVVRIVSADCLMVFNANN